MREAYLSNHIIKLKVKLKTLFILLSIVICILAAGYIFREETLVFNIHDTYYVITYLSLAIFLIEGIVIISTLLWLYRLWRLKRIR